MAPVSKSIGLGKNDFTQNFKAHRESCIEDLSAGVDRLETVSTLPEHDIHGFDNEISLLKDFLLDQKIYNEFKSLVVVGEFGVGKTALCQKIFNDDDVKSVYAPRIWVAMQDNKISVLKRILEGLGVEDSILKSIEKEAEEERRHKQEAEEMDGGMAQKKELSALLYAVNLNLKWKKYLIVFDDVREVDNWNENLGIDEEKLKGMQWGTHLSDGFSKESGGRVIYTTRDDTLAKKLVTEEHEIHRLWPLSDSEIVRMIYEASYKEEDANREPPRNDKKFKDELMNKSRGLPLAARMMAKSDPVFEDISASKVLTDSANNTISEKDSNIQPQQD